MFTGLMLAYAQRVNLSVGIVSMTNHATNPDFDVKINLFKKQNYNKSMIIIIIIINYQVYNWDERERSAVLSSFFWGYLLTQVPGGAFSNIWGPR